MKICILHLPGNYDNERFSWKCCVKLRQSASNCQLDRSRLRHFSLSALYVFKTWKTEDRTVNVTLSSNSNPFCTLWRHKVENKSWKFSVKSIGSLRRKKIFLASKTSQVTLKTSAHFVGQNGFSFMGALFINPLRVWLFPPKDLGRRFNLNGFIWVILPHTGGKGDLRKLLNFLTTVRIERNHMKSVENKKDIAKIMWCFRVMRWDVSQKQANDRLPSLF